MNMDTPCSLSWVVCDSPGNMWQCDFLLFSVGFDVALSHAAVKSCTPAQCKFLTLLPLVSFLLNMSEYSVSDTGLLSSWFDSFCQTIRDSVAPSKLMQSKARPDPCFNESTRTARRLHVELHEDGERISYASYNILKNCQHQYQDTVEEANRERLSNIMPHYNNPHVFKPSTLFFRPHNLCLEASSERCNNFQQFL